MSWSLKYLPEARKDLKRFDGSERLLVVKAIRKVLDNPRPASEGGFGKPSGHKRDTNLTGFQKIKILRAGIRIVYKLVYEGDTMLVIVIGMRSDDEVYEIASNRIKKYKL